MELFFDLVFVLAISRVGVLLTEHPTWTGLAQGSAVLAVLWFGWAGYAWLGNTANSDEGLVRLILFAAMASFVVVSLAVPGAFGHDGLLFGIGFLVIRALHIFCYVRLARSRRDATLYGVVVRIASTMLPAAALLVAAGALHGTARALCWAAALTVDYGGILTRGVDGWRLDPGHMAERHSAVVIIALGESVVALGAESTHTDVTAGLVVGALLGIVTAAALWWAYFDVVALVGERSLRALPPDQQARLARDSYTYLHLPMVLGIVFFANGVRQTLADVDAHLSAVQATTMCGGAGTYLLALIAFKWRNIGSVSSPRLVAAAALFAFAPWATHLPALGALAVVAGLTSGLIAFECLRYAVARDQIRHGGPLT